MLVLSRKRGESIQIDDDIVVTVQEVKGGRVRLSIYAPRSVRIVRKEILDREFTSSHGMDSGFELEYENIPVGVS